MKKPAPKTKAVAPPAKRRAGYRQLVAAISTLSNQIADRVAAVTNQGLVLRNWLIGAQIVEFEQNGADRAKYGERLLETLAGDLAKKRKAVSAASVSRNTGGDYPGCIRECQRSRLRPNFGGTDAGIHGE